MTSLVLRTVGVRGGVTAALVVAAVLAAAGPAAAQDGGTPTGTIGIDGMSMAVQFILNEDRKTYSIVETTLETEEGSITINGSFNPDPFHAYFLGAVDFGAPSVFTYTFSGPIVPTGPLTTVTGSISGGLTDVLGDGISLTPTAAKSQVFDVSPPAATNAGVDVGDPFAVGPGLPGALYGYGPFSSGPLAGPVGVFTTLDLTTQFTLSGGGDIAALTGFASINTAAVPEPASLTLAGVAGLGLAVRSLRRRAA